MKIDFEQKAAELTAEARAAMVAKLSGSHADVVQIIENLFAIEGGGAKVIVQALACAVSDQLLVGDEEPSIAIGRALKEAVEAEAQYLVKDIDPEDLREQMEADAVTARREVEA